MSEGLQPVPRFSAADHKVQRLYAVAAGILFVLGFLTLHIRLIPIPAGEYQPVLFLVLVAAVLVNTRQRLPLQPTMWLYFGLLVATTINAISGNVDIMAFVRCAIGPLIGLAGIAIVKDVPSIAFRTVIYIHALIAMFGISAPEITVNVLEQLGIRGTQYYGGWNAFLASEPSYAALNLMGLYACYGVRDPKVLSSWISIFCAVILALTQSVTGLLFAAILLFCYSISHRRAIQILLAMLLVSLLSLRFIAINEDGGVGERLQIMLNAVRSSYDAADLLLLFDLEPSAAWRVVSNGLAAIGLIYRPLGTGGLRVDYVIDELRDPLLGQLVSQSEVYSTLDQGIVAATPLFNYITFGGLIALIPLIFYLRRCVVNLTKAATISVPVQIVCLSYIGIGVLWQTALTSPFWWILAGAGVSLLAGPSVHPRGQRNLVSTSTLPPSVSEHS
jgi:hypothetical protein